MLIKGRGNYEKPIKTLERLGYQKEGRKRDPFHGEDKQHHDTIIMEKILP